MGIASLSNGFTGRIMPSRTLSHFGLVIVMPVSAASSP